MLVIHEVYGVDIKEYNGSKASGDALTAIITDELAKDYWRRPLFPQPGDMCMMYSKGSGLPSHMGVFIGDGMVLHSPEPSKPGGATVSQIHPVRILNRLFKRLEYYRYDHNPI